MEHICKFFLTHQVVLKLYHFQTNLYGSHKASDSYLEKFNELFDKYMEVLQGGQKRLKMNACELHICQAFDDNIVDIMRGFIHHLCKLDCDRSELNNIKDEMKANAEQFLYLLTFR